jgi:hypothetical protein
VSEEPSATPEGAQQQSQPSQQQPTQPSGLPAQGWVSPGGPAHPPHGGPPQPPHGGPPHGGPPQPPPYGGGYPQPPYQPYGSPPQSYQAPGPSYGPPQGYPPQPYPVPAPAAVPFPSTAYRPPGGAATGAPTASASAQPRIEPVPGTEFGLAYFSVPPTVSGQAVGGLVAGILSIVVSLVVGCFGVSGAKQGWGPLVGGAFAVLATAAGLGAIGLGVVSVRLITRSGGRLTGRGMAIAGIVCGGVGIALTVLSMVLALLL